MTDDKKHTVGLDVIKAFAIFSVLSVHFFLHTSFYATAITDKNMFVQSIFKWIFLSCVPLFLLSTGYLQHKKAVSKQYYFKLSRILVMYLIISIICIIFNIKYLHSQYTLQTAIFSIFNFSADGYAWYVNMFIGLYFIAPFINIIINSINKKTFMVLIAIALFITAVPAALNPILSLKQFLSIACFPNWWAGFYPITYYIIGAYIEKYKPKINQLLCAVITFLMAIIQTGFLILAAKENAGNWFLSDYASIFVVIQSVAIFLALYNIDCKVSIICRVLKIVSSLTLEMYLFSFIFDSIIYDNAKNNQLINLNISQELIFKQYYLIVIPICFVFSFLAAFILRFLYNRVLSLCEIMKIKLNTGKKAPL